MTKISWILAALLFTGSAHAIEFMKCNSRSGKTLWASLGKRANSQGVRLFATELVIFQSPTELQERLLFRNGKESIAAAPIRVAGAELYLSVTSTNAAGVALEENIAIRPYDPKMKTAFVGTWSTKTADGLVAAPVSCSVY